MKPYAPDKLLNPTPALSAAFQTILGTPVASNPATQTKSAEKNKRSCASTRARTKSGSSPSVTSNRQPTNVTVQGRPIKESAEINKIGNSARTEKMILRFVSNGGELVAEEEDDDDDDEEEEDDDDDDDEDTGGGG
jgi:hypothetical protein